MSNAVLRIDYEIRGKKPFNPKDHFLGHYFGKTFVVVQQPPEETIIEATSPFRRET